MASQADTTDGIPDAGSASRRVAVVGMHRSGTSCTTRVVNLLGLPLCTERDLYWADDNPAGHWESTTIMRFNDRLLALMGGNTAEPPVAWEHRFDQDPFAGMLDEARDAFYAVHGREWVWKDPRTCLTLPFWRAALGPMTLLLVFRDPSEVAHSLERREGWPLRVGVALWERYTRSMLRFAEGQPVVALHFDDLLRDAPGTVQRLVGDFSALGVDLDPSGIEEAVASVHGALGARDGVALTARQRRLLASCRALDGSYPTFECPRIGRETRHLQRLFGPSPDRPPARFAARLGDLRRRGRPTSAR